MEGGGVWFLFQSVSAPHPQVQTGTSQMLWLCLIAAATGVSLVPVPLDRIVVVIGLAIQVVFFGNWVGFFNSPGPLISDVYRVQDNSFVFRRVGIYYHHLPPYLRWVTADAEI